MFCYSQGLFTFNTNSAVIS